jgi:hypothetical protein
MTSPNRIVAIVFGALYLIIGALGFTVTTSVGWFDTSGALLFGFLELNLLHNAVHLVVGLVLLLAGLKSAGVSRATNPIVGTAFLAVGIAGLFVIGTPFNILAINAGDTVVNFATAATLLLVGLGAERSAATAN